MNDCTSAPLTRLPTHRPSPSSLLALESFDSVARHALAITNLFNLELAISGILGAHCHSVCRPAALLQRIHRSDHTDRGLCSCGAPPTVTLLVVMRPNRSRRRTIAYTALPLGPNSAVVRGRSRSSPHR